MSVVICYSCDKFSLIATDTMITYGDGSHSYKTKVHPIYSYGLGHCAGAGFGETIDNVTENLNKLKEANFENIAEAIRSGYVDSFVDQNEKNKQCILYTQIATSVVTIIAGESKINYKVFISQYKNDSNGKIVLHIEPIEINTIEILYPSTYSDQPEIHQNFIDNHNLNYTYDGDFNEFLLYIANLFKDIYQDSKLVVSDTCEITLDYFRMNRGKVEPRQFSLQIDKLIENCKNKLYVAIEFDINQQS